MRKNNKLIHVLFVVSICFIFVFVRVSFAIDKDIKPPVTIPDDKVPGALPPIDAKKYKKIKETTLYKPKPDLRVEGVRYRPVDSNQMMISVNVCNRGGPTSTSLTSEGRAHGSRGECRAIIKWTNVKPSNWLDWDGPSERLCVRSIPALESNRSHTFSCVDTLERGETHHYLIMIDSLNWIDESSESNVAYEYFVTMP